MLALTARGSNTSPTNGALVTLPASKRSSAVEYDVGFVNVEYACAKPPAAIATPKEQPSPNCSGVASVNVLGAPCGLVVPEPVVCGPTHMPAGSNEPLGCR